MQPVRASDLFLHRVLSGVQATPRGAWSVLTVTRAQRRLDAYRSTLWLWSRERHILAVPSRLKPSSPRLAPDGTRLAFLSADKRGKRQVRVLDVPDGESRPIGAVSSRWQTIEGWAPDGDRVLLLKKVPWREDEEDDPGAGRSRPRVAGHLPYKQDGGGIRAGYRTQLVELNVVTGTQRVLVEGDFDVQQAAWSPDGQRLAFVRTRRGTQRHGADLWLANADGNEARRRTTSLAAVNQLAWSPDARRLALAASELEGDSLATLYLVDADGSAEPERAVARDLHLESPAPVWHADGRRLAVVAAVHGLVEPCIVDVDTGAVRVQHAAPRHVLSLAADRDGLVYVAATMRRPCELFRGTWDDDAATRVSRFNRHWFSQRVRPLVEKRRFDVPDGAGGTEGIDCWLLRPPHRDPPYPVFVDLHGGPQSVALIDFANHLYWYQLVSDGWLVLAPNAVGSSSYGDEFARRLRGRWGELDLPQVLAVLSQVQAEGLASPRAGCGGKSYGGFLAAWTAGHSDAFERIVVSAPVADLASHFGTSDSGYYVTPYAMDGEIDRHRERFEALSPVRRIARAWAPVLLLQGEDDQRCPLDQSEQLFATLVRAGKPAKLVVYPGGSHSLASNGKPSHRVDYHRRFAHWIQRSAGAAGGTSSGDAKRSVPRSNTVETGAMERQVGGPSPSET